MTIEQLAYLMKFAWLRGVTRETMHRVVDAWWDMKDASDD